MDHVVVDVEIQRTIEDTPGGWDATDKLGVAIACVWEYQGSRMRVYGADDVDALRKRLLRANLISGYNIFRFDFPVIWGLPHRGKDDPTGILRDLLPKTDDMLMRIWRSLELDDDAINFTEAHRGWSLDSVAMGTLGVRKIGNGADAPRWYQAGQIARVVNYCADDVAIERDLCDFISRYGFVVNKEKILWITS